MSLAWLICGCVTGMALLADGPGAPSLSREPVTLTGKALLLPQILQERGVAADESPIVKQVALLCADRTVVPLLLDEASRALFQDARLRGRPVRIQGQRIAGLPYLRVLTFQVWEGDRFRTPEYWCEVCSISWRYDPELCPCCQGPMELRMKTEPPLPGTEASVPGP